MTTRRLVFLIVITVALGVVAVPNMDRQHEWVSEKSTEPPHTEHPDAGVRSTADPAAQPTGQLRGLNEGIRDGLTIKFYAGLAALGAWLELGRQEVATRHADVTAPAPREDTPWDRIAQCESEGDWSTDTGNGYAGGLQWAPGTWAAFKAPSDPDNPADASREQEIAAAERLMASPDGGLHHWPECGA